MATDYQTIEVPIGGGLAQNVGAHQAKPPAVLEATDLQCVQGKRYQKRPGMAVLGRTGIPSSAQVNTVFSHGGTVCALTTDGYYVYDPVAEEWHRPQSNSLYPVDIEPMAAIQTSRKSCNPDVAVLNGYVCLVWEDGDNGGCYACIYYESTGGLVRGPMALPSGLSYAPRVVAVGDNFVCLATDVDPRLGAGGTVRGAYLDTTVSTLEWTAAPSATTFGTGTFLQDVYCASGGSALYAVTGNSNVRLWRGDSFGDSVTFSDISLSGGGASVCHVNGVGVFAVWSDGTPQVNAGLYDESGLSPLAGPLAVLLSGDYPAWLKSTRCSCRPSSTAGRVLVQVGSIQGDHSGAAESTPVRMGIWSIELTSAISITETWETPGVNLHLHSAKPSIGEPVFGAHNQATVGGLSGVFDGVAQPYPLQFLARLDQTDAGADDLRTLAVYQDNIADVRADYEGHVGQIALGSDQSYWFATTQLLEAGLDIGATVWPGSATSTDDSVARVVLWRARVETSDERTVKPGEPTLVAAGTLGCFDGARMAEVSPLGSPMVVRCEQTGGDDAGSTETVKLTLVLCWYDAYGRQHRSPPSNVVWREKPVVTDLAIDFVMPPSSFNGDGGYKPVVEVYATYAASGEPDDADTRTLRETHVPTRIVGDEACWRVSFTFTGTTSNNRAEYGQAGEQLSEPCLLAVDVAQTRDRWFYLPPLRDRVYFSKPTTQTFAPEFNLENYILLPTEGGKAVAIETMDDKLVIFKEQAIYVLPVGAGPNASGSGPSFAVPRKVPVDVGCRSRESVVVIPSGILFQAAKCIYLLDRNTQLQPIGAEVRGEIEGCRVSGACVVPSATEARFFLEESSGTTAGKALIYNYELGVWTTWSTPATATAWAGKDDDGVVMLTALESGTVFQAFGDGSDPYYEESTLKTGRGHILPAFSTAWLDLAGIQGYQRVRSVQVNGRYYGGDVQVELYYDYNNTTATTYFFRGSSLNSGSLTSEGVPMQLECAPGAGKAKCRAIRVRVVTYNTYGAGGEVPTSRSNRGHTIEGIQIEVKAKGPSNKNIGASLKTTNP